MMPASDAHLSSLAPEANWGSRSSAAALRMLPALDIWSLDPTERAFFLDEGECGVACRATRWDRSSSSAGEGVRTGPPRRSSDEPDDPLWDSCADDALLPPLLP